MSTDDEDDAGGIPEWVVTFGDMMSLLLTFFIMLVSLSEIKQVEKYQALVESFRKMFGHETSPLSLAPGSAKPRNSRLAKLASMGRAKRKDTMRGGDRVKAPVGENPRVRTIRRADQQARGGVIYFEHGQAELTSEHQRHLQIAIEELGGKPQKIEVRGHTSRRPLADDSPYRTHWELAYARAHRTMEFLIRAGIRAERIRLNVAAQHEPAHTGIDARLAAQNDRVEVVMVNELAEELQGTKDEQQEQFGAEPAP